MNWDELPISHEQATVVALVFAVVASAVLGPMFLLPSSPTDAGGSQPTATPQEGQTYEYTESTAKDDKEEVTIDESSSRPDEIGDLHEVPDSYTELSSDTVPAPDVKASAGSQTMQVTVREVDGEPVIDLTDDRTHEGRWVSLDTKWFNQTLGETPEVAYIEHESGETYSSPIEVRGGQAVFYVQQFSTNTVTFDGEFTLNATPAADGDQFTYNVSDGADDLIVNVSGSTNTKKENVSKSGVGDGGTIALDYDGNLEPTGPSANGEPVVEFTGNVNDNSVSHTGTTNFADSQSVSVGGNMDPSQDEVTITGGYDEDLKSPGSRITDTSAVTVDVNATNNVYSVYWEVTNLYSDDRHVDVRANINGNWYDVVTDYYVGGDQTVSGWEPMNVDAGGQDVTLEFDYGASSAAESNLEVTGAGARSNNPQSVSVSTDDGNSASFGNIAPGATETKSLNITQSTSSVSFSANSGQSSDYNVSFVERTQTDSPSIDIDGDGTAEAFVSGTLSEGETVTRELSNLSTSHSSATINTATGTTDVTIRGTERTQTVDPVIEINGNTTSHTGALADGETATLSSQDSWIRVGENTVNVTVGDGTLESDAPTPQVNINYSHDIPKQKSVDYTGESWSERYVVSRTWQEDTQNATLKIPWASNRVVALRNVEVEYVDDSGMLQNTDTDPNYYFTDSGALVVELGDVPAGWKTTVDADGSKVQVQNGSIVVTEPTAKGESLDTKFKVDSKSSGFKILVGGTANGQKVHFVNSTSTGWDDSESALFKADGTQAVRMPNAQAGETGRMHTIPLKFSVDTNEIVVSVPESELDADEPVVNVKPGATTDDTYDVTFVNAKDGEDYIWFDQTNNIVVDSGTASSPLTLSGSDSHGPVMQFMLDTESSSSGGGGGGGGGAGALVTSNTGDGNYLPLVAVALILAGLVVTSRRENAIESAGERVGESAQETTSRLPVVGDALGNALRAGVSGVTRVLELVLGNQIAAGGVAVAILLGAVQQGVIVVPEGSFVIVAVAGVGLGSLLVLRQLGEFSLPVWVGINVLTALVALERFSDQGLVAAVAESEVFPIIAIGALYLAYRALKLIQQPVGDGGGGGGDNTVTVQIEDGDSQ